MSMNIKSIFIIGCFIFCSCTKTTHSDPQKNSSYAIGYQIGQGLRVQYPDVDASQITQGLRDSLDGKDQLSQEELKQFLARAQQLGQQGQAAAAEKNKNESAKFLEKNKSQPGWKTTESGLQYKVNADGNGPQPEDKHSVILKFTGTLTNGTKFDSSPDSHAAALPVGSLVPGLREAVKMMKVGAKWQVAIPPQIGFGATIQRRVPPNSVLLYELELEGLR